MKKSLKVLSLVLVALFTMSCISVSAGFNGNEAVQALYLDFETNADIATANGGAAGKIAYYKWLSGEGVGANSTNGALKVCPAAVSDESGFANGFQTAGALKTGDTVYNLSFKYMVKADGRAVSMYPLVRATASSGTVTRTGSLAAGKYDAETFAYTNTTANTSGTSVTTVADGNWYEYNWQFKFDGSSGFGIGSNSLVTVDDMDAFRVCIRLEDDGASGTTDATSEVYIDDLVVEPVGVESYPKAHTKAYVGDEILPAMRTITTYYSTSIGLGQSAAKSLVEAGTDVSIDNNGRGTVKTAGQSGDMAFMAVAESGERYVRFQGQSDTYTFLNKLDDYTLYQVTVRAKAPEFTVDETITDTKYHVSSDGTVKVASGTNGKIGGTLKVNLLRSSKEGARAVVFTGTEAGKRPTLTSEWVDYVGYTYFKPTEEITWASIPYIEVSVDGNAGIFYVDELSIKPVVSENLILNGDLTVTVPCKYPGRTDYVSAMGIVPNCEDYTTAYIIKDTTGLYVYNSNSATTYREVNTKAVLEAGKTYKLEVKERMASKDAVGSLAIDITKGNAVQTIASDVVVYDTYEVHTFKFTPSADIAATNAVDAASINFKTTRDETATSGKSYYYEYFRLTELPAAYVEDIAVTGDLTEGKTVTATWKKSPADSTATQVVKVSVGSETDGYALIDASSTVTESKEVVLPVGTKGKNIKVEIITYVNGEPLNVSSYVTSDVITEAPEVIEGVTVTDAVKNEITFDANVSYVGTDDAFILVATYDANGKMVNLLTFDLAKDGTVTPVSITNVGAASAKVMVFDGLNLTETNIIPMCDFVEIR